MAFVLNDRVKETTTTNGTSTINLAGAETGFESFVAGIGNSNTTYYAIVHQTADEFEVGIGTVTDASPDTLSRTTIISSSNSDSAVNFSSGTKDVFCTLPASKSVFGDASGNVGIGTTSPAVMLDVRGEVAVDYNATYGLRFYNQSRNNWSSIGNSSTSNDAYMVFKVGLGEALKLEHSKNAVFSGDTITVGDSHTFGNGAGDNLHIESSSGENIVINSAGGIIVLQGGGTERFRLDSSGNMSATGNITAYGSVSDERLKENIEVIENPIEKIKNLKGVTFTYKKDEQKSTGLIAQDLEKVLPEAVYKTLDIDLNGDSEDEHLAIRYGNTVGLLVEAIKELEARVKELEDK